MVLEKNPKTRHIVRHLLKLEDQIKGKPFPDMTRVKEISNYACGPATLEMLLSFVKVKVTQLGLIRSAHAQKKIKLYGLNMNDMARAVRFSGKKKFNLWKKQRASVSDISLAIDKYKFPVGVEWQGEFYEDEEEDKGHYCVVTKVDKKAGFLRIADPYFNSFFHYKDTDRKFETSKFVKKWWDINEIKVSGTSKLRKIKDTRMMFVITPKDVSWPKKLGMVKAS